eukprot:5295712-Prymnesium_polylepis.1
MPPPRCLKRRFPMPVRFVALIAVLWSANRGSQVETLRNRRSQPIYREDLVVNSDLSASLNRFVRHEPHLIADLDGVLCNLGKDGPALETRIGEARMVCENH